MFRWSIVVITVVVRIVRIVRIAFLGEERRNDGLLMHADFRHNRRRQLRGVARGHDFAAVDAQRHAERLEPANDLETDGAHILTSLFRFAIGGISFRFVPRPFGTPTWTNFTMKTAERRRTSIWSCGLSKPSTGMRFRRSNSE